MISYEGVFICVALYSAGVLLLGASITAGLFVFHVAVVPLVFKYSKTFRRSLIFANFVQWPLYVDFEDPSSSGIEGGRNLSIQYHSKTDNCDIKIGIWHILPKSVHRRLQNTIFKDVEDSENFHQALDQELADSEVPIILYCHGNSNSRAAHHRIELYKFFQNMDFHTIAFDYRGYGDSTNLSPSEPGVVEDSLVVYEWLHKTASRDTHTPTIYVWGHSLGTGISSHLLGNLEELSRNILERSDPLPLPKGLILEAPFSNLADEVEKHPLSKLVTWLPYYGATFVSPFRSSPEYSFRSDEYLSRKKTLPVLILHAEDDVIVPYVVGQKLYKSITESRRNEGAPVILHSYKKKEGLGHKWICHAKDLREVVRDFVKTK